MANDKEINVLARKLVPMGLAEQLQRDMDKWAATLLNDGANGNKRDAVKRLMLLIGSGNLKVLGNKLEGEEVTQGEVFASANNLPIAFYLSGHGGRVYMSLDTTPSQGVLNWITSDGIHKARYFRPGNREKDLVGKEIVYDRHAGTHSAKVDKDGNIQELKGRRYGVFSILGRMLNYITFGFFFSQYSQHLGMNIPFGGEGQKYKNVGDTVKGDGSSGHLYINAGNDFLGVGMEGTAPGSEGPLGSHSNTGAADRFTPGEGQKSFVKFDLKDKNFLAYLEAAVWHDQSINGGKWTQMKSEHNIAEPDIAKGIKKLLETIKMGELIDFLKVLDLHVLMDENGKPEMISTTLGFAMMKEGMTVPYNYNGQKIKFSDQALMDITGYNGILPNEIIYFKPQDSVEKFMAQAPIFADINNKSLIKNNPQLSLKECFALSLLYDWQEQPGAKVKVGHKWDDVKESDAFLGIMKKIGESQEIHYYNKLREVLGEKVYLDDINKKALENLNTKPLIRDNISNLSPEEIITLSLLYDKRASVKLWNDSATLDDVKKRLVYKQVLDLFTDSKEQKSEVGLKLSDDSSKVKTYEEALEKVSEFLVFKGK